MKLVRCIINPVRLETLTKALWSAGFRGVTVSEAKGLGLQKSALGGKPDQHVTGFGPRLNVEVAVNDEATERVVAVMVDAVRTGRVGDGKIFVTNLDQVIRVRTGERGDTAL